MTERGTHPHHSAKPLPGPDEERSHHFLMCLLNVSEGEQLEQVKQRICSLLPEVFLNQYFEEKVRERIEKLPK